MAAALHDILQFEETAFVDVGVEVALHGGVVDVGGPADEVVDGALRTVGVVDFEAVALCHEVVADGAQAVGGFADHQGRGLEVAVDAGADEVVGAVVADFEDGVGDGLGEDDELGGVGVDGVGCGSVFVAGGHGDGHEGCKQ